MHATMSNSSSTDASNAQQQQVQPQEAGVEEQKETMDTDSADSSSHPEAGLRTSDFYHTKSIPERFDHPDWFEGYSNKQQSPFYQTSTSVYGSKPPSVHTMPTEFHGRTQKFSQTLGKFGMYRNHSLNTALDRSKA